MGRMVNRRRVMGGSKEATYIQDGLVFWLDGIDKGNDPTAWTDLINGFSFPYNNNVVVNADNVEFKGNAIISRFLGNEYPVNNSTIEIVCTMPSTSANMVIFMPSKSANISFGFYNGTKIIWATSEKPMYQIQNNSNYFSVSNNFGYENGTVMSSSGRNYWGAYKPNYITVGGGGSWIYKGSVYSIRIYNRILSSDEVLYNYNIDLERFKL